MPPEELLHSKYTLDLYTQQRHKSLFLIYIFYFVLVFQLTHHKEYPFHHLSLILPVAFMQEYFKTFLLLFKNISPSPELHTLSRWIG